jgi:hypothetical protein
MTAPPTFVPPGLNKVPTPPMRDANGEVRGKLADFFFDHDAGTTKRVARPKAGGHWDSDALLMSYSSPDTKVEDSTEDEGPEGNIRAATVDPNPSYGTPGLLTPPGGYMESGSGGYTGSRQRTPEHEEEMWFRVPHQAALDEAAGTLRELEERRKFEWIVPEHLPSSPLCPLHAKYTGYSKGHCYWHTKKKKETRPSLERVSVTTAGRIQIVDEGRVDGVGELGRGVIGEWEREIERRRIRRGDSLSSPV